MDRVPWSVGSFVHVVTSGSRGLPITKQGTDRWRFHRLLYYMNDANKPTKHWQRDIKNHQKGFHFKRPPHWPDRDEFVDVMAYCLMDNHYHLLLRERLEGGVSEFVQRLNSSMSNHFKKHYDESGLLDTPYTSRVIDSDAYLTTTFFYVNVKNPFERLEGGYSNAAADFDGSFDQALSYPFVSLSDYKSMDPWPIINQEITRKFIDIKSLKDTAETYILSRPDFTDPDDDLRRVLIDA